MFSRRKTLKYCRQLLMCLGLLMLVLPRPATAQFADSAWEHQTNERGVAVYIADSKAHSYDVVKAVALFSQRPQVLIDVLRDIERYPRWYRNCTRTRVLARPRELSPLRIGDDGRFIDVKVDESYMLFFRQRASPLDDRWAIVENRIRIVRGSLVIDFRSLDRHPYKAPAGAVRMRVRGRWVLTPLSKERTRVSLVVDVDPNTGAPAFLVDPNLHAMALHTVADLRTEARARAR